ncbi:MAG: Na+/H+ antiporter subunit E, partial [Candidatus Microthrix parvicella]
MLLFAWLVVMWTALWGVPTLANLLGGAVVASVVLWVFPRGADADAMVTFRPVHAAVFLVWFLGQLVSS